MQFEYIYDKKNEFIEMVSDEGPTDIFVKELDGTDTLHVVRMFDHRYDGEYQRRIFVVRNRDRYVPCFLAHDKPHAYYRVAYWLMQEIQVALKGLPDPADLLQQETLFALRDEYRKERDLFPLCVIDDFALRLHRQGDRWDELTLSTQEIDGLIRIAYRYYKLTTT